MLTPKKNRTTKKGRDLSRYLGLFLFFGGRSFKRFLKIELQQISHFHQSLRFASNELAGLRIKQNPKAYSYQRVVNKWIQMAMNPMITCVNKKYESTKITTKASKKSSFIFYISSLLRCFFCLCYGRSLPKARWTMWRIPPPSPWHNAGTPWLTSHSPKNLPHGLPFTKTCRGKEPYGERGTFSISESLFFGCIGFWHSFLGPKKLDPF